MKRKSPIAGTWYPGRADALKSTIEEYFSGVEGKSEKAIGVVAPHAGYIYSGAVAGAVFARVEVPEVCLVFSPNHTGAGAEVALWDKGSWDIPLGEIPVNTELCELLKKHCKYIQGDTHAHINEHSLEIELPFLKLKQPSLSIAPVTISTLPLNACLEIGSQIAEALKDFKKETLIVASTDMTHYESHESAQKKDKMAIEKIIGLDPEGLYNTVRNERISMCGVIPVTIMLSAAKKLGAIKAKLIKYDTSASTSGDYSHVVGYAGLAIK